MSLISVQVYLGNQGCGSGKTPAFAGKKAIGNKQSTIGNVQFHIPNIEC